MENEKITKKFFTKSFIAILLTLAVVGYLNGYYWRQQNREKAFEMTIFNLKNSQAIFIRTPNDKRILINGGSNSEIVSQITKILPFYSRYINTIIATKDEAKYVTGLIDVLNRYSIDQVILPAISLESLGISTTTDQIFSEFINTIQKNSLTLEKVQSGDRKTFDSVVFNILFPTSSSTFKYSKTSRPEILLNIEYADHSIIFANNVTPKIQKFIASTTPPADILILFDNASADNLAGIFAEAVKSKYLIYSEAISGSKKSNGEIDKINPLFYLMENDRFNIREKGIVKIKITPTGQIEIK